MLVVFGMLLQLANQKQTKGPVINNHRVIFLIEGGGPLGFGMREGWGGGGGGTQLCVDNEKYRGV